MNFKQYAKNLGFEEEEYIELLHLFIQTGLADLIKLKKAMIEKNANEVEKAAHSLKGAAGNLGLTAIAELAKMIEKSAEKDSMADVTELTSSIKKKIINIKHQIASSEK